MAPGTAACFRLDEVRGVAVDVEAHADSVEPDDGVRLRGRVVHENVFFWMVSVVGEAFSEPILLRATSIMGSTECAMYKKVPAILCTCVMPRLLRFGAVEALGEYCTLAPYVGAIHLWGECWGRVGMECWKRSRALRTELGTKMST